MEAAHTSARQNPASTASDSERTCLVTGDMLPKDDLIRFVVSPDGLVVPDLAHQLPGRGLWVKADYATIDNAARKNLFSKAAKESVKAPAELATQVATLLRKRCLDFIGLACGAGLAILGQTQVEAGLKAGKIDMLLLAPDAGADLGRKPATVTRVLTRAELGAALGHTQIVYAGLKCGALTDKLKIELARLEKILSSSPSLSQETDA
jgi:predicted RNA-binding protein YlxR (DUF448 family)